MNDPSPGMVIRSLSYPPIQECTQTLRIISSREVFLADKPFESLEAAETYAHDAFSSANYLVLGKHTNMMSTIC